MNLEPNERKLINELEEGGSNYQDQELWLRIKSKYKRKHEANKEIEDIEEMQTATNSAKRQKLITDFTRKGEKTEDDSDSPKKKKNWS